MRKLFLAAASLACLTATPALAGVYGDELTKCVVTSSTDQDKLLFVKYIFSAMAEHPAVKPMANVGADTSAALDRDTSTLFNRLLFADCRKQMIDVIKYEGLGAVGPAFGALGEVAMRSLMSDPAVSAKIARASINPETFGKLPDLYKDAGVPLPPGFQVPAPKAPDQKKGP